MRTAHFQSGRQLIDSVRFSADFTAYVTLWLDEAQSRQSRTVVTLTFKPQTETFSAPANYQWGVWT